MTPGPPWATLVAQSLRAAGSAAVPGPGDLGSRTVMNFRFFLKLVISKEEYIQE